MEEITIDSKPKSIKERNEALGRILWGKNGSKFSMRRFAMAAMKKLLHKKKEGKK